MPKKVEIADKETFFSSKVVTVANRFDCLLDGNVYRYQLNIDYTGKGASLVQTAKRFGVEQGRFCQIKQEGTDFLIWLRDCTERELERRESAKERFRKRGGLPAKD